MRQNQPPNNSLLKSSTKNFLRCNCRLVLFCLSGTAEYRDLGQSGQKFNLKSIPCRERQRFAKAIQRSFIRNFLLRLMLNLQGSGRRSLSLCSVRERAINSRLRFLLNGLVRLMLNLQCFRRRRSIEEGQSQRFAKAIRLLVVLKIVTVLRRITVQIRLGVP